MTLFARRLACVEKETRRSDGMTVPTMMGCPDTIQPHLYPSTS